MVIGLSSTNVEELAAQLMDNGVLAIDIKPININLDTLEEQLLRSNPQLLVIDNCQDPFSVGCLIDSVRASEKTNDTLAVEIGVLSQFPYDEPGIVWFKNIKEIVDFYKQ